MIISIEKLTNLKYYDVLKQRYLILKLSIIWIYECIYNTGIIHISFLFNHQISWKLVSKTLMSFINSI